MMVNSSILTFICSLGLSISVSSSLNEEEQTNIVDIHNDLRRNFAKGSHGVNAANMDKLVWSEDLAEEAASAIGCTTSLRPLLLNLELNSNLYREFRGNFADAILSWYNEMRQFIPEEGTCWMYRNCLHAMTILNARHRRIGCAYNTHCTNRSATFLCLYRGGQDTIPVYSAGVPCSRCSGDTSFCDDGLCDKCNADIDNCDCRKTCNKPGVGFGSLDNSTCTCTCDSGLGSNCDEPCENPSHFEGWDICAEVTPDMCTIPGYEEMLAEQCPEQCSCRPHPSA